MDDLTRQSLASAAGGQLLRIALFDAAGRRVNQLECYSQTAGIRLPATDSSGRNLRPGSYWVRIASPGAPGPAVTLPLRRIR